MGSGKLHDTFRNGYSFYGVSWAHGGSVVSGEINGVVLKKEQFLIIEATVDYHFSDRFEDVLGIGIDLGTPYPISGYWRTRIEAIIKEDGAASKFP